MPEVYFVLSSLLSAAILFFYLACSDVPPVWGISEELANSTCLSVASVFLGVFLSILCVQLLFDKITTRSRKKDEDKRIQDYYLVSSVVINKYVVALNILCTLNEGTESVDMNEIRDFNLRDMAELYDLVVINNGLMTKTKILIYIECRKILINHLYFLLETIKFEFNKDVLHAILAIIEIASVYRADSMLSTEMLNSKDKIMKKLLADDDLECKINNNEIEDDKIVALVEFYKQVKKESSLVKVLKRKLDAIN